MNLSSKIEADKAASPASVNNDKDPTVFKPPKCDIDKNNEVNDKKLKITFKDYHFHDGIDTETFVAQELIQVKAMNFYVSVIIDATLTPTTRCFLRGLNAVNAMAYLKSGGTNQLDNGSL